ncbi:MAG: hypothetical protein ABFD69_10410 [Candidatus Sumerlaeia bacterium]
MKALIITITAIFCVLIGVVYLFSHHAAKTPSVRPLTLMAQPSPTQTSPVEVPKTVDVVDTADFGVELDTRLRNLDYEKSNDYIVNVLTVKITDLYVTRKAYTKYTEHNKSRLLSEYGPVDVAHYDEVMKNVDILLSQYWDKGDLLSTTAYEKYYDARILCEELLRQDPDNIVLIDKILQVLCSGTPPLLRNTKGERPPWGFSNSSRNRDFLDITLLRKKELALIQSYISKNGAESLRTNKEFWTIAERTGMGLLQNYIATDPNEVEKNDWKYFKNEYQKVIQFFETYRDVGDYNHLTGYLEVAKATLNKRNYPAYLGQNDSYILFNQNVYKQYYMYRYGIIFDPVTTRPSFFNKKAVYEMIDWNKVNAESISDK